MINYNKKYLKIKDELIKKSFPELKGKKIFIREIWMRKHYSGWACYIPPFKFIGLSRLLRKSNNGIIIGIISHELSHFSVWAQRSLLKNTIIGISYWLSSKTRKEEEYAAENLLIKRGYAKEVYAASKNKEKLKKRAGVQKYYLLPEEIKNYAKSIGKW